MDGIRDLIVEEFPDGLDVRLEPKVVKLVFSSHPEAERAYELIKNCLELDIPIQIRKTSQGQS